MAKIAIIEDDIDLANTLKIGLEAEGYHVQVANDGTGGKAMLMDYSPDIVLLDIMMPGLNGDKILEELRHNPDFNASIVVLTNMNEIEGSELFKNLHIADYIVKSEMPTSKVIDRVKNIINESINTKE